MIRQTCTTWRMMPVARAGKALALPVGPKRYLPPPWYLVGPSVSLPACSLARHSTICAEQDLTVRLHTSGLQKVSTVNFLGSDCIARLSCHAKPEVASGQ